MLSNSGHCYLLLFCNVTFSDMKALFGMMLLKEEVFILMKMDLSGLFLLNCGGI
jgi:hypothetical protein